MDKGRDNGTDMFIRVFSGDLEHFTPREYFYSDLMPLGSAKRIDVFTQSARFWSNSEFLDRYS